MTSLPPGEGAPGYLRPAPKREPTVNGGAPDWKVVAAEFADPEDPGPGALDCDDGPRNVDMSDVFIKNGAEAVRAAFANANPPPPLPLVDFASWTGDPPPRRSLWGDMIPLLQTTMLTGPGGVGKSLFEQSLCTAVALGLPYLGTETTQRNALYITCEDDADELWRRQDAICAAMNVTKADLAGKLFLCSLAGEDGTSLADFHETGRLQATNRWRQIEAVCQDHNIGLFAFDNATDAMAGDLNDIHQVAEFVNLLTGHAIRCDGAAMILHHPNKAGDQWLGSIAWHNKVRSRLLIEHGDEGDPDARVLQAPKANYGPSGGRVAFRWHRGAFVRDEDLPSDYAAELSATIRVTGENSAFLACLRARAEQGEGRGVGPSPGPNYAPAQFEGMAEAKGLKKPTLKRAMDRLFAIGKIESHTYRNKAKARDVTIIREVPDGTPNARPNASRTLFPNDPEPLPEPARTHTVPLKGGSGRPTEAATPEEGGRGRMGARTQTTRRLSFLARRRAAGSNLRCRATWGLQRRRTTSYQMRVGRPEPTSVPTRGAVMSGPSHIHEARKSKGRSRITNGSEVLPGVDGRSTWVRRLRDLQALHIADLGGDANVSQAERSIVRRAATLTVELERMEAVFATAGEAKATDLAVYTTTTNALRRLLADLGLSRRASSTVPSLSAYMASKKAANE